MNISDEIVGWLLRWQSAIDARDFEAGRALFSEGVKSFGTFSDHVNGLDDLVSSQWREIWPVTRGFRFDLASLSTRTGPHGDLCVAALLWSSEGVLTGETVYPRRGRATIVLERGDDGELRAVHTHFSMSRGYDARRDDRAAG